MFSTVTGLGTPGISETTNLHCLCVRELLHKLHLPVKPNRCPSERKDPLQPRLQTDVLLQHWAVWQGKLCRSRKQRLPRDSCHYCPDKLCNSKHHVRSILEGTSFPK